MIRRMSNSTQNRTIAIGDTVRILNCTYGLAPSRRADEPSLVVEVVNPYTGLVRTASGRFADPGNYEVVARVEVAL